MKVTILFQNSLSDNNDEFFKKKKTKQLNLQSKLKSLKLEIPFSLDGYNFFLYIFKCYIHTMEHL